MLRYVLIVIIAAAAGLAAAGFASTAPSRASAQEAPQFETADCPMDVPDGQEGRVRCGYVTVPEDRAKPDGRQVRLAVAVIEALTETPAPDPVLYLSGGPGGPSLAGEMGFFTAENALFLQGTRDIVFYDQRGTGFSDRLDCSELRDITIDQLARALTPAEAEEDLFERSMTCAERLRGEGVDFRQYNSAASARDIVDVMTALGYEEWNLFGVSYGTRLALTAMRETPERIRSVVLDSVLPPQVNTAASNAWTFQRSLFTLFEGCAADAECAAAFPDLQDTYWDLIERANADPIEVTINDRDGKPVEIHISGHAILNGTFVALYSTNIIPVLPLAGDDIARGNTGILQTFAQQLVFAFSDSAQAMGSAVMCNEDVPLISESDVARETSGVRSEILAARIGITDGVALRRELQVCEALGTRRPSIVEEKAVESDIPALVLSGEYDPITPPAWGELAASTLSNARYYEFRAKGHGVVFSSICGRDLVRFFVARPDAEAPPDDCVAALPPPDFAVPEAAAPEPPPSPTPPTGIEAPDTGAGATASGSTGSAPGLVRGLAFAGAIIAAAGWALRRKQAS